MMCNNENIVFENCIIFYKMKEFTFMILQQMVKLHFVFARENYMCRYCIQSFIYNRVFLLKITRLSIFSYPIGFNTKKKYEPFFIHDFDKSSHFITHVTSF